MTDSVLFDLDDGVLTVTLNEPETMNSLTPGISQGIAEAMERAADDAVRAVVLTGNGRGFCAGASITGSSRGGPTSRSERLDQKGSSARTVEAFANCEKPIIGAINGAAVGAGFGLAVCCDVRILGESARMGSIFIKRGLASDYGAAFWLPRLVGTAKAFEIMYSGELLEAQACEAVGLANRVVPDGQLLTEAQSFARMIADGPPLAYTVVRRMLQRSHDMPMAEFAEYEWTSQKLLLKTKDSAEAFKAFREKREPKFIGE